MKLQFLILILTFTCLNSVFSQSKKYVQQKQEKIEKGSVFTKKINRELPATIEYEDDEIIAFVPLRLQAPSHLLIVPKKEINTINDADEADIQVLGKMLLVAKKTSQG